MSSTSNIWCLTSDSKICTIVCEYSPAFSQKTHIPKHRNIILWFKSIFHEDFLYFFSECLMPLLYCSLLKDSLYDFFNCMCSSILKSYYNIYWKKSNPNKQSGIQVNWEVTAVSVEFCSPKKSSFELIKLSWIQILPIGPFTSNNAFGKN